MSGLVVKNSNELWFNNNKLSTSTGTNGLYIDNQRNLFFNNTKIASGNLSNPKGLHLINGELVFDGNKLVSGLSAVISSLYSNNEQGFAYDFNDLSSMFQDIAGTIPVTTVGQSVARVLDKSGRGNHLIQSTLVSRPILRQNSTTNAYYLEFDGVNDFLVTENAVDFRAKNEVTLFAGLRKLSDAALGMVMELSPTTIGNNGTFYMTAPNGTTGNLAFGSKGTSLVSAQTENMFAAPISGVFYGYANIAKSICSSQFNAGALRSFTTSQGTGNYGNHLLYIGRRGGSSLPFAGHLYSLVVTSRAMTTDEQTNVKNLIAKNVGVTL